MIKHIKEYKKIDEYLSDKSRISILLGEDNDKLCIRDLTEIGNMVLYGNTGFGQSLLFNKLFEELELKYQPDYLQFVLIDRYHQMEQYWQTKSLFNGLLCYDEETPLNALKNVINEIDSREKMFKESEVDCIEEYNGRSVQMNKEKIPYIVIFIQNCISYFKYYELLSTVVEKSKQCGVYVIFTSDRPLLISETILKDFDTHVVFNIRYESDKIGNMTSEDYEIAKKLDSRKGEMLFISKEEKKVIRQIIDWVPDKE